MERSQLRTLLDFALDAAWQAGRVTLSYFQTGLAVERKADKTEVTRADRESEQKLRELIARYWPGHSIIGEEFGAAGAAQGLTWVLDPIDGTRSFIHGVPLYATLVALVDGRSAPLLGVAHFPGLDETVWAAAGEGCYWNGRRCAVSAVAELADAALMASEADNATPLGRGPAWQRLLAATGLQRTWGDAYGYALVATGRAEIMVDPVANVWDIAPMQVILEEAGGRFTDWSGRATIYGGEGVATNAALHSRVIDILAHR